METLKSKNGITLTTLIVMVVVMTIIAGVSIYAGGDAINLARVKQFNTELRIIQTKVDEIAGYNLTMEEQKRYGQDIDVQTDEIKSKIITALGGARSYWL